MKSDRQLFGRAAEDLAAKHLRQKVYRILGRNVRLPGGELDIVAQSGDVVVFVEVKARRTDRCGGAPYSINGQKQQRVINVAAQYMAHHDHVPQSCRFDVVLCQGNPDRSVEITHILNMPLKFRAGTCDGDLV